jgi:hypothetical protein
MILLQCPLNADAYSVVRERALSEIGAKAGNNRVEAIVVRQQ